MVVELVAVEVFGAATAAGLRVDGSSVAAADWFAVAIGPATWAAGSTGLAWRDARMKCDLRVAAVPASRVVLGIVLVAAAVIGWPAVIVSPNAIVAPVAIRCSSRAVWPSWAASGSVPGCCPAMAEARDAVCSAALRHRPEKYGRRSSCSNKRSAKRVELSWSPRSECGNERAKSGRQLTSPPAIGATRLRTATFGR
jgi:hypothetical protein